MRSLAAGSLRFKQVGLAAADVEDLYITSILFEEHNLKLQLSENRAPRDVTK